MPKNSISKYFSQISHSVLSITIGLISPQCPHRRLLTHMSVSDSESLDFLRGIVILRAKMP